MTVTYFPEMGLFVQSIDLPEDKCIAGTVKVTFKPTEGDLDSLEIPLEPDYSNLEKLDVELHSSPTQAYNMGDKINGWFTSCFGFDVVLLYLGPHLRPVLGNMSPDAAKQDHGPTGKGKTSWLSGVTDYVPDLFKGSKMAKDNIITFADFAPYLIVIEESLKDISTRLPEGVDADVTKFRPNVVISGSETAFEEDFWGALDVRDHQAKSSQDVKAELVLTQNCIRCRSLDINYSTGRFNNDEGSTILKKLMRDRRVDAGKKFSPVFGRYAFLKPGASSCTVAVGDHVLVSKRNSERTKFCRSTKQSNLSSILTYDRLAGCDVKYS